MSIWDNVRKLARPYADDDYDEYDDEEDSDGYEGESGSASRYGDSTSDASGREDSGFDFDSFSTAGSNTAPATGGFNGQVVNTSGSRQQVFLFRPENFNDTSKAADELRNKKAVIVNMENIDKAMARRVVDFLSGCVYMLDGNVRKVAQSTYLFYPHNVDVTGSLDNLQSEVENYV